MRVARCGIAAASLLLAAVRGQAQDAETRLVLEVGYTTALSYDIAVNDSRTATRGWAKTVIDRTGIDADADVVIFENLPPLVDAVNAHTLDLAILLPLEFLEVGGRAPLLPMLTTSSRGSILHEYVLLVPRDSGMVSLAGLSGRSLILERGGKGRVPGMWLDVLLLRAGLARSGALFSSTRQVTSTSRAVLPVFFGQADACVVSREGFETMVELNPQLGEKLRVLAISPGFLRGLVCLRQDVYEQYGDTIMESLLSLHTDPRGQQLLRLFHVSELVRVGDGFLDQVIALSEEHEALTEEHAR